MWFPSGKSTFSKVNKKVEINDIVMLMQQALMLVLVVAAPAVVTAAAVGLVVAVIQATTQIQDQSVSQALKLGAVVIVLAASGSWMGAMVYRFGEHLFANFPAIISSKE
jgi:type III secretion protein S